MQRPPFHGVETRGCRCSDKSRKIWIDGYIDLERESAEGREKQKEKKRERRISSLNEFCAGREVQERR